MNTDSLFTEPMFVVVEGMEAVGKSTVVNYLRDYITYITNKETITTREPGGTPLAEEIRKIFKSELTKGSSLLTQCHLIAACRADHLDRLIVPSLASYKNVVCDRFILSTLVYQEAHNFLYDLVDILVPDLTIVLTASSENVAKRMVKRDNNEAKDWWDEEVSKRHAFMQDKMLNIVRNDAGFELSKNYLIVDTNQYEDVQSLIGSIDSDWGLEGFFCDWNHKLYHI